MGAGFGILGPVTITGTDGQVVALAPRYRAVLAYLLLHRGVAVGIERLIGAMWGGAAPDTARAQVHTSVAAVRRALREAGAEDVVTTHAGGYVATPAPGALDLDVFEDAMAAAGGSDPVTAAAGLRRALGMWRGEALAGIGAAFAEEARARLAERRLTALERLAELELSLGEHEKLIGELAAHVAEHPTRERLTLRLMTALHRSGRQADALAAGRAFRERLADEQGLDPSREFTALEHLILRGEAEPAAELAPASFLPYDLPDFTGRDEELRLLSGAAGAAGGAVWAVNGMAGSGKTSLVVHAAHRLAADFPDGRYFIDLHAHTAGQRPVEPDAALEALLRQSGLPAERIPLGVDERGAVWRARLAGRRTVIVLDNAADAEQVRPLLPGTPTAVVLVTSRVRLVDLDGARALTIEQHPVRDALALFGRIVGERATADPVAALDVVQQCGFLPLAVRIAAARLANRPRWSVEFLAGRLRDHRHRMRELATGERGVAAAFDLSYRHLDPAQRRLFRLLGAHPGADFDAHAAAALIGGRAEDAEELLETLLDAHVLTQHEAGRYTFHDLLRDHARVLAADEEDDRARHEALVRLFDHYRDTAAAAVALIYPREKNSPGVSTPFHDAAGAAAWLETECANIVACAGHTVAPEWPAYAAELSASLYTFLGRNARHDEAVRLHTHEVASAVARGDLGGEATARTHLGTACWRQGRFVEAAEQAELALVAARAAGDLATTARALTTLGNIRGRQGDYGPARSAHAESLAIYEKLADATGQAASHSNLGLVALLAGDLDDADHQLRQALALHREHGDRLGEASTLGNLGSLALRREDLADAEDFFRQTLAVSRDLANPAIETAALVSLGKTDLARADHAAAAAHFGQARDLAVEKGYRPERANALLGLARAELGLGDRESATEAATEALALYEELGLSGTEDARSLLAGIADVSVS